MDLTAQLLSCGYIDMVVTALTAVEELGSDSGADLQSGAAVAPPDEKKPDSGSPNDAVEPMALRALSCLTPG